MTSLLILMFGGLEVGWKDLQRYLRRTSTHTHTCIHMQCFSSCSMSLTLFTLYYLYTHFLQLVRHDSFSL